MKGLDVVERPVRVILMANQPMPPCHSGFVGLWIDRMRLIHLRERPHDDRPYLQERPDAHDDDDRPDERLTDRGWEVHSYTPTFAAGETKNLVISPATTGSAHPD